MTMRMIYKYKMGYPGPYVYQPEIEMTEGAVPLSVGMQGDILYLWALVDPRAPLKSYPFIVIGTGVSLPERADHMTNFIGTVPHDKFVWHVFERIYVGDHGSDKRTQHDHE